MFLKFTLLVIGIIFSGILTVVALIFGVVGLGNQKKSTWYWFMTMALGLALLGYCVHTLTYKVQQKVTNLVQDVENGLNQQLGTLDTSLVKEYHQPAVRQNGILDTLRSYTGAADVPESFYTYLGFRDYYRLPITYPFSIHCIDELKNGQLFNEKLVTDFDRNDNGEIATSLNNIQAFVADRNYLLAETYNGKRKEFVLYDLTTDRTQSFSGETELLSAALQKGYKGERHLKSCTVYFERLTK